MKLVSRGSPFNHVIAEATMERKLRSLVPCPVKHCVIIFSACLAGGFWVAAADFKGAAEVLRQAAQASPKPKEKPKDPNAPFREKLKAFAAESTNLPPSAAATRWLALVEEFEKVSTDSTGLPPGSGLNAVRPLQFDDVMKVLPPPGTWTELEK